MKANWRFSVLPFPQFFDGARLTLNVVMLPRNQNPLKPAIEGGSPAMPDAPPFAAAALRLEAHVVTGTGDFPNNHSGSARALDLVAPARAEELFVALGKNFGITNLDQKNDNYNLNFNPGRDRAEAARPEALTIRKYLPRSYRESFNFTLPRTPNAVTDDGYLCAVRGAARVPGFKRDPDEISWGRVFAFALRQPQLAKQLGMIYETGIEIRPEDYPQGGWLHVALAADSDYQDQQDADPDFIKSYAARIPALRPEEPRQVFAPLLFPVLFKPAASDPDPAPDGNYDELFIEAAIFDDGFAKIVHARQPPSRNLLLEDADGAHPIKDIGIRLGWDDEQILVWYMRQMRIDPTVSDPSKRLDAPLGVFGYAIDVRERGIGAGVAWQSLNLVTSRAELSVPRNKNQPGDGVIGIGGFAGELPYQVYPAQLDGDRNKSFWLPMYFANWNGSSMVLPDDTAARIYQTTAADVKADPEDPVNDTGTGVSGGARNRLNQIYEAAPVGAAPRYGRQYEFRVRLRDLSGGGAPADPSIVPINESPSSVGACRFRRFVAPNRPRIENLSSNTDAAPAVAQLDIRRPLLGYPAVTYTGGYADPVARLAQASQAMIGREAFGIADPDVNQIEIVVEVQTLKMHNLLGVSGRDNYAHLYTTRRRFPAVAGEDDYEQPLAVPVVYKDCKVLHTGDAANPAADLELPGDIDDLAEIVLPTARTVRLTIRAVCEDKAENEAYYGTLDDANHDRDSRFGQLIEVMTYQPSEDETDLFVDAAPAARLRGILLQPDPPPVIDGSFVSPFVGKQIVKAPDMIQRLAEQLDLDTLGLTLTARKGERVQFGCSNRIRHTLAPEASSLTFSSKGDLMNHWLCCVQLQLDRDWTWDALAGRSFVVRRTLRFTRDDAATETETAVVGDIEIRRTASFESLHDPRRDHTRLVFIDAVEPKNTRPRPAPDDDQPRFPDTIEVSYTIETNFKPDHAAQRDAAETLNLRLPITTPPAQVPRIASAGIALSPYRRNESYSATEPRRRFLWIEFAEPVADPGDTYFARLLAYAPDQLISDNRPELFAAPDKPTLPLDPELVRVVPPGASNDLAGLRAMQPMQKATDDDRHYLLPLPPGIHADAAEMFGFFTYEFRVGHYRDPQTGEMAWSTAQGRYGRPLRVTGIQHPAPALACSVGRDEEKLFVSAPFATAVAHGKNVTADPPRTELWCLLYAQVRQADDADNRNILLDDKQLDHRVQIEDDPRISDDDRLLRYDDRDRRVLRDAAIRSSKNALDYRKLNSVFKLADVKGSNKDRTKRGTAIWSNDEVSRLLKLYGLPTDAPLSVLIVEVLPTITNSYEHVPGLRGGGRAAAGATTSAAAIDDMSLERGASLRGEGASPLSDELGHHRILRTSPLTEVPFVCCADC